MKTIMICVMIGWMLLSLSRAEEIKDIVIENDTLRARINPLGAELISLKHKEKKWEFLWHGDPKFWSDRSPLMFPVNVRLKDDRYSFENQNYVIPKMGLAIYRLFESLPSQPSHVAKFVLVANKDTLRQYPFRFRLQVTYTLDDTRLIHEFSIENQDDKIMPFAIGSHPGFSFPITNEDQRGDFEYWFSKRLTVDRHEIKNSLIQPNTIAFLNEESTLSFGDPRIPDSGMLLLESPARTIGIARKGKPPFVTVDLGDFPNVNLWSPPGYPFACIEPMISHHDFQNSSEALEDKSFLIRLQPGESKVLRYVVTVYADR